MSDVPQVPDEVILQRQARKGWLIPYLIELDTLEAQFPAEAVFPGKPKGKRYRVPYTYRGHGRWNWWLKACYRNEIPEGPIPPVYFQSAPESLDEHAIQDVLEPYVQSGEGDYADAWLALVQWILYGFNYNPITGEDMARIPSKIKAYWYRNFNLGTLLHSPCDWSAHILQNGLPRTRGRTRHRYQEGGYFSTPLEVCQLMAYMAFEGAPRPEHKFLSFLEPCAGTGSILLVASNYSLRLHAQEKYHDLVLCTVLNGYLFAPWMVAMPGSMRTLFDRYDAEREREGSPVAPVTAPLLAAATEGKLEQLAFSF
jgi:hypothetical protein